MANFAREGHENNFHLIRHAAAIAVVLTHSYSVVTGLYESEPLVAWLGRSIGHYAVDVFFVLSGFVVTQSLARDGDLIRFTASRLLRVFPALIAAVVLTTFVLGPLVSSSSLSDYFSDLRVWTYFAGSVTTLMTDGSLPGVFTNAPDAGIVNASLWTLKYELTAYFALGILAGLSLLGRRVFAVAAVAAMIAIYVIGRGLFPWPETESFVSNALHLLLTFFIGALAFALRRHIPLTPLIAVPLLALTWYFHGTPAYEVIEKLLIAYTVIWIGFLPASLSRKLARMGDISYGIYILAFPIQQTIQLLVPGIQPLELFILALLLTVPLAILSWQVVERPSLAFRNPLVAWLRSFSPARKALPVSLGNIK